MKTNIILWFFLSFYANLVAQTSTLQPIINTNQHINRVDKLLYAEEQGCLISISADKTIRILNLETYKTEAVLHPSLALGRDGILWCAALSADETILAVGGTIGEDKASILLIDWQKGKLIKTLRGHKDGVLALDFSADNNWLVSGGKDNRLKFWSTTNWELKETMTEHTGTIQSLVIAPNSQMVASAGNDKTVKIWKLEEKKWQLHQSLEKHQKVILSVAFSPDNKTLVSGGEDGQLITWKINQSWQPEISQRAGPVGTISFSKDGTLMTFKEDIKFIDWKKMKSNIELTLQVFDINQQQFLPPFKAHTSPILSSCFIGLNQLASASGTGSLAIHTISDNTIVYKTAQNSQAIIATAFADKGLKMGFGATLQGASPYPLEYAFDWNTFSFYPTIPVNENYPRTKNTQYQGIKLSLQDMQTLQLSNGQKISFHPYKEGRIQDYSFTPDGSILVAGDYVLKKVNQNGQTLQEFVGHTGEIRRFSIAANGSYLISGATDHQIKLWNLETAELLASFYLSGEEWICWSPQGYFTASPNGKHLLHWLKKTSKEALPISSSEPFISDYYYQPKVLKKIITLGTHQAINFETNKLTIKLPVIKPQTSANFYDFRGIIQTASPIKKIELFHNGTIVPLNDDFEPSAQNIPLYKTITLKLGGNEFRLKVSNKGGEKQEEVFTIKYIPTPELVLSAGHSAAIKKIVFSNNGALVATTGLDNHINIWDFNSQQLKVSIQANEGNPGRGVGLEAIQFSKDDKEILCSDGSQNIRIYEVQTGQLKREMKDNFRIENYLNDLIFNSTEDLIITGDAEGVIKIWNRKSGQVINRLTGHTGAVKKVTLDLEDKVLYSIGLDRQIIAWNFKTGTIIKKIPIQEAILTRSSENMFLKLSDDGQYLIAGTTITGSLYLFQTRTLKKIKTFKWDNYSDLMDVDFIPHQHQLVIGGLEQAAKIWDIPTDQYIKELRGMASQFQALAVSPNGKYLASSHGLLGQAVINIRTIENNQPYSQLGRAVVALHTIAMLPKKALVVYAGADARLHIWNFKTAQKASIQQPHSSCIIADRGINKIVVNAAETIMVTGGCDGKIVLWTIEGDRFSITDTLFHKAAITDLAFSSDGHLASTSVDKTVKIWDINTRKCLRTFISSKRSVSSIAFSPDNQYLAGGHFDKIFMWDWKKEKVINTIDTKFQGLSSPIEQQVGKEATIIFKEYLPNEKLSLVFTPNSQSLLVGGEAFNQGTIYEWSFLKNSWKLFSQLSNDHVQKITCFAFDASQQYLVIGTNNPFIIKVLDVVSKKIVHSLIGHQDIVTGLTFNSVNNQLLSTSHDGSLKIWNWEKAQLIASLRTYGETDFIISKPDYFFYSNKSLVKEIAFKIGNQIMPFEQFDLQLNRPDVVLTALGAADKGIITFYKNVYLKRLKTMNFEEHKLDLDFVNIPTVQIKHSSASELINQKKYKFKVIIKGKQQAIKQLRVYVNDVPVYGRKGLEYKDKQTNIQETITIDLSQGRNKIQVSAINQSGVESLKETFYKTYQENNKLQPDLHILAFGVNEYNKDTSQNLTYPEKDVLEVSQFFQNQKNKFNLVKSHLLLGEDFNLKRLQALKNELQKTKVDDVVIVFYAGHGVRDNQQNYFLTTTNTDFNVPKDSGIPYKIFEDLLDEIPARQKLLIVDACYSGEVDKADNAESSIGNSFKWMKDLFIDLRKGTGTTIIASASGVQQAQEANQWQNSAFTHILLKGLKEKAADFDEDGSITVTELQRYIALIVPQLTKGLQQPTFRMENISNDFRVW